MLKMFNRAKIVDQNFLSYLDSAAIEQRSAENALDDSSLLELFDSQMTSRLLDFVARELRAELKGFYTIGSSGHEGNAVVGRLTRLTDPALLHYRSGAFVCERARRHPESNFIRETLLGLVASSDEPIAGGRHKVWGSKPLWILPQTSTIGSHPPRALGMALGIERVRRLGCDLPIPKDSIVICSFGEAGSNHATAQGALNAASYTSYRNLPAPVLFVCEDNGLGISVTTPPDWIESAFKNRPAIRYFQADGLDLEATYAVARQAVEVCRMRRCPVFLHLRVVRLLGHAGSDLEASYRTTEEIEATEAQDPLIRSARIVMERGLLNGKEIAARYEALRSQIRAEAELACKRPKLTRLEDILKPLSPYDAPAVVAEAERVTHRQLPEPGSAKHLAVQINRSLFELAEKYSELVFFGEDIARKGGVYHLTAGLLREFGSGRVFDTILDETTILGTAQGLATLGVLPMPEIQYLAYLHNAIDQLRGEACSLQFFSNDQFRNPMVVRIAAWGYQKGFGGHFHNDNGIAPLRDIPGLIIAAPARGDDAVKMLRTALALAKVNGRIIVFLEPIALYMTRDLYEDGDGLWLDEYPPQGEAVELGKGRVYNEGASDLLIISFANGLYLSLRAARRLEQEEGVKVRLLDLRWLAPLNASQICEHAAQCDKVLVVDEGRRSGGMAEPIITALVEGNISSRKIARHTGADTYIPLGDAANLVLPSEDSIVDAAKTLLRS